MPQEIPGSWGNGLKVAIIDSFADQEIGIAGTVLSGASVGAGITQAIPAGTVVAGAGTTSLLDGYLKGIITGIDGGELQVKVLSHYDAAGTRTQVDYTSSGVYKFNTSEDLYVNGVGATTVSTAADWFNQQEFTLTSSTGIKKKWASIAPRPGTSSYAAARGGRFDELHIVVIDAEGKLTGNEGTILEKHVALSKASDAVYSVGSSAYWRAYLASASTTIFGGGAQQVLQHLDSLVVGQQQLTLVGINQQKEFCLDCLEITISLLLVEQTMMEHQTVLMLDHINLLFLI